MKRIFTLLFALVTIGSMAATAPATHPTYRGKFIGDGTGLTNAAGVFLTRTYAGRETAAFTNIVLLSTANDTDFVVLEYDPADASLLLYDQSANKLAKFSSQGELTNFLPHVVAVKFYGDGSGLTNITTTLTNSVLSYLTVQATPGTDGIVAAVRRATGQSNDVFQVQTAANGFLFGVEPSGIPRTSSYRVTTTNAMILTAPDGGTWLLNVNNDGSIVTRTNSTPL